ncbi:hypothetical protein [Levilactobacillus brevis]|uniref:hypothetical protein n=1 Tax=Levilactobacillus brevis TaxID=1580 RepID=UPI0035A296E9
MNNNQLNFNQTVADLNEVSENMAKATSILIKLTPEKSAQSLIKGLFSVSASTVGDALEELQTGWNPKTLTFEDVIAKHRIYDLVVALATQLDEKEKVFSGYGLSAERAGLDECLSDSFDNAMAVQERLWDL